MMSELDAIRTTDGYKLSFAIDIPENPWEFGVVLVHDIYGNKDDGNWNGVGFFSQLSAKFATNGLASARFDFRGHGMSDGRQTDFSLSGAVKDLVTAVAQLQKLGARHVGIVSTGLGSGISVIYAGQGPRIVDRMVMICPNLDFKRTLLGSKYLHDGALNASASESLVKDGLIPHGEFKMGPVLVNEIECFKPANYISFVKGALLTLHAEQDSLLHFQFQKKQKYYYYGKGSKLAVIKGAGHGPSVTWSQSQVSDVLHNTVHWFLDLA